VSRTIRIGNGCGFWGDNLDAPIILAERGQLDYLTLEYLAELTMSILALQKQRNPEAGFASDFLDVLERLTTALKQQPRLKIITNAGGMNPHGCARRARHILESTGIPNRRIATVVGDDLIPDLDRLLDSGHPLTNLDTARPLQEVRDRVVSANAYLGAKPIADALSLGADIVITGRVADASLTLAPAVHEFGWHWDDWDRLSAGSIAGHLIECGAQVTGGLWSGWEQMPDPAGIGYPIAELDADGVFRITKPPGTGGAVNFDTVRQQLLYEVADPAAYLTPDVVADFTSVNLQEKGTDTVEVRQALGKPATPTSKVSIAYRDGYVCSSTLLILGSVEKSRRCGEVLLERVRRAGFDLERTNIECLGGGDLVPGVLQRPGDVREVVLRVSAHDHRKAALERFAKEFAPLVTSGPMGVTGYTTGRPVVREVFAYWPALIEKSALHPSVMLVD
jgi:acyclic terpene utilization AtuA family protein